MKKRVIPVVATALCFFASQPYFAQNTDYHPYKEFGGEDVEILTLSNGKYNEFFDTDSIEIIGSAVLNTNTMTVIGFYEHDTLYSEATLEPEVVSRWLSRDPLASKYPYLSPYNFVGNNPISFIDPDGREIKPASNTSSRVFINTLASFTKKGSRKQVDKLFGLRERAGDFTSGLENAKNPIKQQVFGIQDNFTPKKFEKRLGKLVRNGTINSEQAEQAKSIFNVLQSKDIVELAVITNGQSDLTKQESAASSQTSVFVGDNLILNDIMKSQNPQIVVKGIKQGSEVNGRAGNGIFGFFKERDVGLQNINLRGTLLIDARGAGDGVGSQSSEGPNVTNSVGDGIKNFENQTGQ